MKIDLHSIKVSDLVADYEDNGEGGVRGYSGCLNIRPAYQREFIYAEKQRNEVINTVRKGFPLNTMYWVEEGEGFELMDGQQRTISICQYIQGDFSVLADGSPMFFHNLTAEKQQQIMDYELSIYWCEGTPGEKLDWFKIINIAGLKLTDQELRNAMYTGPWLADAKRWFSRRNCPASQIGEKYVNGDTQRQEVLEKALEWITGGKDDKVEAYMSVHQHDADAQELWVHFQTVIDWVKRVFPNYRGKLMKGLDWGRLYRDHGHRNDLNPATLEKRIVDLIEDDEVDSKKGIYEYLLTDNEKTLNLRGFDEKTKVMTYEKQQGICSICKNKFDFDKMEADHIIPWTKGGKTEPQNCRMLCMMDNRTKSGK